MKACKHTYGINRDGYGNDEWITDPDHPLISDDDTDLFKHCPDCGQQLSKDEVRKVL